MTARYTKLFINQLNIKPMLSQEVKDQIRKDVLNEIALNDAIYIMDQFLGATQEYQEFYKEKMQAFVNKQKSK